MNYEFHYNRLNQRSENRLLEGYTEKHHIIPRCMGGTDDPENIAILTAREHHIAHQLLVKIYPGHHGLISALNVMRTNNSKEYSWIKRLCHKQLSKNYDDRYGVDRAKDIRHKQSVSKMGNTNGRFGKGRKATSEQRARMSEAHKGQTAWNKGKKTGPQSPECITQRTQKCQKPCTVDGVLYSSRNEAATKLNINITTIYRWLANGRAKEQANGQTKTNYYSRTHRPKDI